MSAKNFGIGVQLEEPINVRDLMGNGVSFRINQEDEIDLGHQINEDLDVEDDVDGKESPWTGTFNELRADMERIPNLLIYKKVSRPGHSDEVLGTRNARVYYHYSAFLEKSAESFDSTYINDRPSCLITTECNVLPGIYDALQTMCPGEEAHFLIDYSLLYGELGCPPRVPGKADCLFVIELKSFRESGDGNALDNIDDEERTKFSIIYAKAQEVHKKGLDSFNMKRYPLANAEFSNAIRALECCNLASAEEESRQHDFLVKLYRNQAVCFNQRQLWKKTCIMCQQLIYLSKRQKVYNFDKDCKAQFHWGRALLGLCEYGRAREYLNKAKRLEPNNSEISKELLELENKERAAKDNELQFAKRAAQVIESVKITSDEKESHEVSSGFQTEIRAALVNFSEGDEPEMVLPDGLNEKEINFVKGLAENMKLKFRQRHVHSGRNTYIITRL